MRCDAVATAAAFARATTSYGWTPGFSGSPRDVHTRATNPPGQREIPSRRCKAVPYLEAWHIIDMANVVCGFGNWDAEMVDMKRGHDPIQMPWRRSTRASISRSPNPRTRASVR
jgi:hypothetical protein